MKALTLTQPWATLVAVGAKAIETRSWGTSYRGPVAIHAAKGFPRDCMELCFQSPFREALALAGIRTPGDLPRGSVIAMARIVECERIPACDDPWSFLVDRTNCPHEDAFGDYAVGRFAWSLADVLALPEPIPAKGALGLWELNAPAVSPPAAPTTEGPRDGE